MPLETELKLRFDPRHIARLTGHALLKQASRRVTRKLYSVYYDTPELDLWRAGVTLRLRRSGKRWIQTVKSGGSVAAGLHRREEVENGITSSLPDFEVLQTSALGEYFSSPQLRPRLHPQIVTEFTRTSCTLTLADGVAIEVCFDRGHVKSGEATASICEIELELKEGPVWRVYQLALQLLEAAPLLIENRSKAELGIALHLGTSPTPVKTAPPLVVAGMCANDLFKALVLNCIEHYTNNQRGMLDDDDPEYLHQMRVALRRLRSVFSTFAPLFPAAALAPPMTETRWLGGVLGSARDWDVFATEALPPLAMRYEGHLGLATLARATARMRAASNRQARQAVASARGQGLMLALGAWTSAETWLEALDDAQRATMRRPAIEYAREVLRIALRRVRKRGRNFENLAPADLHRLRVAAKRLRYATEFFAPFFDQKAAREYRAALARLQDALGSYNDAVKMTVLAERASRRLKGVTATEARGIILGWSAGMQDAGIRYLQRVWKDFRTTELFWK